MGRRAIALGLLWLGLAIPAVAGETARQYLDRRKALDDGERHWDDRYQHLKLSIVDRRGGERLRELEVYEARYPEDEQKTILFFRAPAEVKGTGFLAFTHRGRPADQWLYLPELKRVRQITARARNESFVGTDLSYHDLDLIQEMISWSEDDARSSLLRDEAVDGVPTHVIELVPKREDIGYSRIVLWLGTEDYVPRRLEFYEDASEPKKRLTQHDVRLVGKIPVAHQVIVETPAAGSRTTMDVAEVRFNQGLKAEQFSQRYLEQGSL
jgi:outer membrane lipoprotein-sorting protein